MMHVLDSSALLALFQREEGYEIVEGFLSSAKRGETELIMSEINYGEVLYISGLYRGKERMREVKHLIEMLPLRLVPVNREAVERAAELKVDHPIAYGDAFAVALALEEGAILATKDRELESVSHRIEVLWI